MPLLRGLRWDMALGASGVTWLVMAIGGHRQRFLGEWRIPRQLSGGIIRLVCAFTRQRSTRQLPTPSSLPFSGGIEKYLMPLGHCFGDISYSPVSLVL